MPAGNAFEESGYEPFACPLKRPCKSLSAGEFKKCIPSRHLGLPPVMALSKAGLLGLRQEDSFAILCGMLL
jgi:hypothetical protein